MTVWDHIIRLTWILIVAVVVVGVICVFLPQYAKYRDLQRKRDKAEVDIIRERALLKHYQQQSENLSKNRDFVEKTARKEGMIKTNEVLFRLETNTTSRTVN